MLAYQNNQPLTSICIPTYNAEKTVVSTVQSILNQTYQNLEIIIVDNASTDNTLVLLQQFKDSRIKIYRNEKNIGAEKNWNRCIELATGEYIAIFHADDLYKPDIVEKQVQAFHDNPSIGAVFTMTNHINEHDEVIGEHKLPVELKGKEIYYFPEIFISILKNLNFLVCPSAMVRSEIYKELTPFDYERFGTSADLDMWLKVLEKHPIAILDEKLMSWRRNKIQGSYLYNYLRTEQADFFKVMDFYLSKENDDLKIPQSALSRYELQRTVDNITRSVNFIFKSQPQDAKKLLKKSLSSRVFRATIDCIKEPKYIAYCIFGVLFLFSINLRIGLYFVKVVKVFSWLLYLWKRMFR
ncbi:hypothetical protein HX99_04225 [Peptococcaceae bacterium SCADC1_2_3]|nr:hypothetical protein DK28_0215465 [Peptococcaceae bacterium SCADC1_2_3]KFI36448.1 hypothetical protein HX99_04225 [Peptococcaceae bacterium SCADC1_2_3]KFI37703.1 hypothetical protein HY02_04320 [Peptococcaceae bacterium SCADC1_2_3]